MANATIKQFPKCCFALWFYNVTKKIDKRKEENETFLGKKQKKKQCYHNDNCR